MRQTANRLLAAAFLCIAAGHATGQPAGSAGEAAGTTDTATRGATAATNGLNPIALGAVVANPGSFQMQAVTQKVDITDAMMAGSDHSDDWILHGRTYDNQRFSPFDQVN